MITFEWGDFGQSTSARTRDILTLEQTNKYINICISCYFYVQRDLLPILLAFRAKFTYSGLCPKSPQDEVTLDLAK